MKISFLDSMVNAYIEAAYFTDVDELNTDNPDFTPEFERVAYAACRDFVWALDMVDVDSKDFDPTQMGHDLWFTRNGHGVGFWDRPEVYGELNAKIFSAMAKAQGSHDAEFRE
jgi:hypothetical protein